MERVSEILKKSTGLQYAFIDESGNFGFDFDDSEVSPYFIITAVIVDECKIHELESRVEAIAKMFFQTGEMKSSAVGNDDVLRFKILEEICKLDFHVFSLIIDKKNLYTDGGLKYKEVFIKFLNEMLHRELYTAYPRLQMAADEHGNKEFMDSFIKYVERNHQPTLFEIYGFSFINSKSGQLIKLADFICGTIAKGYQENQRTEKYNAFMKLLKPKIVGLKLWPETYKNYLLNTGSYEDLEYDEVILQQGIRLADLYMERYEASEDPEVQERILFLKFLKSMLYCQRPDQYVSTREIIKNLSAVRRQKYSNHYFRTRIVAKLRDEGVIIASSPLGYKLPISQKELYDFVNQSFTVIMPMLSRLKKCREQIKAATKNELDILDKPEYEYLKKYFDDKLFNQGE